MLSPSSKRGGGAYGHILGIVYIPLDDGGAWKTLLARELQAAGYDINLTKLL